MPESSTAIVAHTPGPWRAEIPDDNPHAEIHAGHLEVAAVWWGNGYVPGQEFPPIEQAEANARLIAAAPELLTLVKEHLEEHLDACHITRRGEQCLLANQSRQAIAKAEGLAP